MATADGGGACTLYVARHAPDGAVVQEATVALTAEEYQSVWKAVLDGRLYAFQPAEREGRVFDYGTRRLEVAWEAAGRPVRHEVRWEKPLRNRAQVDPLFSKLAKLARQRAAEVRLEYLTPQ